MQAKTLEDLRHENEDEKHGIMKK